jgi:hypothetical protein
LKPPEEAPPAGIPTEDVGKAVELSCKVKIGAGIVMKNGIRDITGQECESEHVDEGKAGHPCCK